MTLHGQAYQFSFPGIPIPLPTTKEIYESFGDRLGECETESTDDQQDRRGYYPESSSVL